MAMGRRDRQEQGASGCRLRSLWLARIAGRPTSCFGGRGKVLSRRRQPVGRWHDECQAAAAYSVGPRLRQPAADGCGGFACGLRAWLDVLHIGFADPRRRARNSPAGGTTGGRVGMPVDFSLPLGRQRARMSPVKEGVCRWWQPRHFESRVPWQRVPRRPPPRQRVTGVAGHLCPPSEVTLHSSATLGGERQMERWRRTPIQDCTKE